MLSLSLNRESTTPLQLQIFQYYFQAIQHGDLLCGDKLPSHSRTGTAVKRGKNNGGDGL
nr:GntR family transcriptional regulator [Salmonella sp. NCTC 7297]